MLHQRRDRSWATLATVLFLLASAVPFAAPVAATEGHPNTAYYATWSLDKDRNQLDDRLDADLAAGAAGIVHAVLHYDRRPTEADAAALRTDFGAVQAYVFRSWDMVQVETTYDRVAGMRAADGVVMVEKFEPPEPLLDTSTKAIRVRQAAGVAVQQGLDHLLSVHETLGFRGEGMVVAILDTGVDNSHESLDDLDDDPTTNDPKLVQKTDPLTGVVLYGAVDTTSTVPVGCINPSDDAAHGTHVAGIALGTGGPNGAFRGVAPKAKLVEVKIGTAAAIGILAGLDWIVAYNRGDTCYGDPGEDRIDVASMSFTAGGNNPDTTLSRTINSVVRSGLTFVIAAGNSGAGRETLTTGSDGAIIVANSDDRNTVARGDDRIAASSSRGPRRPDADVDRLDELRPDVAAPGTSILAPLEYSLNQYIGFSGTSMAAPHIGGLAALMLQANPHLHPVASSAQDDMGGVGAVPLRDLLQKSAQFKWATDGVGAQRAATGKFGLPWN
ncbi:MAG TPA: S8 family serine peptidase, partial [Egibacteraceae bacterium]|nr:S8 family serine peptidase [Egibacteraceae bacterium]